MGSDDACVWLYGLCVYAHRGPAVRNRTSLSHQANCALSALSDPSAGSVAFLSSSVLAVTAYLYPRPGLPRLFVFGLPGVLLVASRMVVTLRLERELETRKGPAPEDADPFS